MNLPQNKKKSIRLAPLEQRYVISCEYPIDCACTGQIDAWKTRLYDASRRNETFLLFLDDIQETFPTFAYLINTGQISNRRTSLSYFEGMDKKSHNYLLHELAKVVKRNPKINLDLIRRTIYHATTCSTKVAKTDGSKIWTCDGIETGSLDDLFGISPRTDYVLVHGKSEKGHVIIREAVLADFEKLKKLPELWRS